MTIKPSVFWYLFKQVRSYGRTDGYSQEYQYSVDLPNTYININGAKTKIIKVYGPSKFLPYRDFPMKVDVDKEDFLLLKSMEYINREWLNNYYFLNQDGELYRPFHCPTCSCYTHQEQSLCRYCQNWMSKKQELSHPRKETRECLNNSNFHIFKAVTEWINGQETI